MVDGFSKVLPQLANIFLANSLFYVIMLVFCLLIVIFYSKKFALLIDLPITCLMEKLNSINAHLLQSPAAGHANDIVVIFDDQIERKQKYHHTCKELSLLEYYIT